MASVAWFSWPSTGNAVEHMFEIRLSALDTSQGYRIDRPTDGGGYQTSVASAGDVNGDGNDDIIVARGLGGGEGFVLFGSPSIETTNVQLSSLDGSDGIRFTTNNSWIGQVAPAGDVNGDGLGDFLVGSPYATFDGIAYAGAAYVVFGRSSASSSIIDLDGLNGSSGFRVEGVARSENIGRAARSAGDVNGDGFDDVVIGSYQAAYVVFGKPSGFSSVLRLSSLDGQSGIKIRSTQIDDLANPSVNGAGDVNGDGYHDIIIGSPAGDDPKSYVVFGRASWSQSEINLSSIDGTNGFSLLGEPGTHDLGYFVISARDFNGDGYDDVVLMSDGAAVDESAYLVFGKPGGFPSVLSLSDLDGTNGSRIDFESSFAVRANPVGDFNNDGFDDLVFGITDYPPQRSSNVGSSRIVFGRSGKQPSVRKLYEFNSAMGIFAKGVEDYEGFGASVASAGDVNGDGFDDVIVGTQHPDGAVAGYVMFGRENDFLVAASLGPQDGEVVEDTESSGIGGTKISNATSIRLGDTRYNQRIRAILSFDTSGIPDGATVKSATLYFRFRNSRGQPLDDEKRKVVIDLKTGSFGGQSELQPKDFQATGSMHGVTSIPIQSPWINTEKLRWYEVPLSAASLAKINKFGLTQIRVRLVKGINHRTIDDYFRIFSGSASESRKPHLVVQFE